MTDLPERIWAWNFIAEKQDDLIKGGWDDTHDRKSTEYIRADLAESALEDAKMHHAQAFGAGVDHAAPKVKPLVWEDRGTFLEAINPLGGMTLQAADKEQAESVEAKHQARVRRALE